jgi:inosose dehydratase
MSTQIHNNWSRRRFVKTSAAVAAAALAPGLTGCGDGDSGYAGFRLAFQTYGLRHFPVGEALAMVRDLGISQIELWNLHNQMSAPGVRDKSIAPYHAHPGDWGALQPLMQQNGIQAIAYGAQNFNLDFSENRAILEWAQRAGVEAISAHIDPRAFDYLDGLVEETGVKIGIHNHGPGWHHPDIPTIADALKDHHPNLGLYADTQHFFRSAVDPVEAVETFIDRLHGIHLKDVKHGLPLDHDSHDQQEVLGEGQIDIAAILRILKQHDYRGLLVLEYEAVPENPIPSMKQSLQNLRDMCANL